MDPQERLDDIEKLKQQHAALEEAMIPPVAPELTPQPLFDDKIAKANRKALDLSDATVSVFNEQDQDERVEFEKTEQLFKQYQTNLMRFLQRMQDVLIESVEQLEVLESHWQRLK